LKAAVAGIEDYQRRVQGSRVNWATSWEQSFDEGFLIRIKEFISEAACSVFESAHSPTNLRLPGLNAISRRIHPACEMYKYIRTVEKPEQRAIDLYFQNAEYLINNLLRFFAEEQVDPAQTTILDFASGYGRFARYLVKLFREVTVSDVEQEMLDFCRNEFGVQAFLSSTKDPTILEKRSERYDVVFCFSLFTHLNEVVWRAWFEKLFTLVADRGYLIISTHGYKLFERLNTVPPGSADRQPEVLFLRTNETLGRLDPSMYGSLVVKDEFVRRAIFGIDDIRIVKKYEIGEFDLYHDIYIFQKNTDKL